MFCPLFPTVESLTMSDDELCRLANAPLDDSPIDHLPAIELQSDCDDDVKLTF